MKAALAGAADAQADEADGVSGAEGFNYFGLPTAILTAKQLCQKRV